MKTIGLIGGTTWISTIDYYRNINLMVGERLGSLHSAKLLMYSVDYEEIRPPDDIKQWGRIEEMFCSIASRLEKAGAECLVICANTPHLVADRIQESIHIPLIHIAETTATAIMQKGLKKVGLLGTKFTMEQSFFTDKLSAKGISTIIPPEKERDFIHQSIFQEMASGLFLPATREKYLSIIRELMGQGAEGIIFGCTEIPILIRPDECDFPVFDTTVLHSTAAVDFALSEP